MAYNIGVANFVSTWFSTWQWSDLPWSQVLNGPKYQVESVAEIVVIDILNR